MNYLNRPIKKYLRDLAAGTPAPGGGSAAALSAAMAAGLVAMASAFVLGKEKYRRFAPRAKKILARSLKVQRRLGVLIDEDVKAYASKDMDQAMRVPAEVSFLSCQLLEDASEVLEKGNKRLASDAMLAGLLAAASLQAGLLYVEANAKAAKNLTPGQLRLLRRVRALARKR